MVLVQGGDIGNDKFTALLLGLIYFDVTLYIVGFTDAI